MQLYESSMANAITVQVADIDIPPKKRSKIVMPNGESLSIYTGITHIERLNYGSPHCQTIYRVTNGEVFEVVESTDEIVEEYGSNGGEDAPLNETSPDIDDCRFIRRYALIPVSADTMAGPIDVDDDLDNPNTTSKSASNTSQLEDRPEGAKSPSPNAPNTTEYESTTQWNIKSEIQEFVREVVPHSTATNVDDPSHTHHSISWMVVLNNLLQSLSLLGSVQWQCQYHASPPHALMHEVVLFGM